MASLIGTSPELKSRDLKRARMDKIWTGIFVVTQVINNSEEDKKHLISILNSVKELIPFIDGRQITKGNRAILFDKFYKSHNVLDNCTSRGKLLQWCTELYNFVEDEKRELSYFYELYKPEKLTKDVWGRAFWGLIHTISRCLPRIPTTAVKELFRSFVNSIMALIPCEKCKRHSKENMSKYPLEEYIQLGPMIFLWGVMFHNKVNDSEGKPHVDFIVAWTMY